MTTIRQVFDFKEFSSYEHPSRCCLEVSGRFADALSRFGGVLVAGQADTGLLKAILEAAAYAATCDGESEAPTCTVPDSD